MTCRPERRRSGAGRDGRRRLGRRSRHAVAGVELRLTLMTLAHVLLPRVTAATMGTTTCGGPPRQRQPSERNQAGAVRISRRFAAAALGC